MLGTYKLLILSVSILGKIQIPRLRSSLLILKDVYEEKDVRSYDNLEYEKKDMLKNDLTI